MESPRHLKLVLTLTRSVRNEHRSRDTGVRRFNSESGNVCLIYSSEIGKYGVL